MAYISDSRFEVKNVMNVKQICDHKLAKDKTASNKDGLNINYSTLFSKEYADKIFKKLEEEITYLHPDLYRVVVYGRSYPVPRRVAAYGDEGVKYTFSGTTLTALPWTSTLDELRHAVEKATGETFNFVLVNRYKDGKDRIGAHRDNEPDIVPNSVIASLSFGQKRDFVFQRNNYSSFKISLEHGSLLVMKPPTNQFWYHSLPKMLKVKNVRINLTFRKMKMK